MLDNKEERLAAVKDVLFNPKGMLMTKPIKSLKNRVVEGVCTGYTIGIDNLSYRGIWVSTLEDIELSVDGVEVPKGNIYLSLNGKRYPSYVLENQTETYWGIEDECCLTIDKVGGLAKGSHTVKVKIVKRMDFGHSYGEGTEGYADANEFTHPDTIKDTAKFEI